MSRNYGESSPNNDPIIDEDPARAVFFSQAQGLENVIDDLAGRQPPKSLIEQEKRIALLVSGSPILSLLPETTASHVFITNDDNRLAARWQAHSINVLKRKSSPAEYLGAIWDKDNIWRFVDVGNGERRDLSEELEIERESAGTYHFLSSQARYEQCKTALRSKETLIVPESATNSQFMGSLGQQLLDTENKIVFADFANLGDRDAGGFRQYTRFLSSIFNNNCLIVYSSQVTWNTAGTSEYHKDSRPEASWRQGLEAYVQIAKNSNTQIILSEMDRLNELPETP